MVDESADQSPQPDQGLAAELWHAGRDWMTRWSSNQPSAPDIVYHYTDAAGLLGIIQTKQLWASHAAFLNDSTEIVYIREVLKKVTTELNATYDQTLVRRFLAFVEPWFSDRVGAQIDVFLACFCENGDQLSQWRGYPSAGGGYAIGFKGPDIAKGRMMIKVIYERETQEEIIRALLGPSCELLARGSEEDNSADYLERCLLTALDSVAANLGECSFCFKHHGFREEQEWRLIRLSMRDRETPYKVTPSFRPRATGVLPYIPLQTERNDSEPSVAEVVVGPSAQPALAVSAAEQLLVSYGYDNAAEVVKRSEIPLRV